MQRCANCGAELPENARFCGNCGTVPPQTNPWSQQAWPSQQPQQAGGWPQQQPSMPQSNGWPQPTPAQQPSQAGGWPQPNPAQQQPSQAAGWPQSAPAQQQPSQAAGWPQPNPIPTPAQQPSQNGSWQQFPSQAGGWPQQASEQYYAQSQSAPPSPSMPPMSQAPSGGGWQQQQPPFMPPPGGGGPGTPGRRSTFPRWIFIALIAVLLIGGGITAFALLNHHSNTPLTGTNTHTATTTATSAPTQTVAVGNTPVLGGGSPQATVSAMPSCSGSFSRTGSFSFSGAVSGQMTVVQFAACGPISVTENGLQVKEYVGIAMGTIGTKAYEFIFGAFPYNNPGTFQTIEVVGRLTDTGTNQVWQDILGAAPGTITVNADGKSGSLNITMPQSAPTADPNSTVKVTGTWSS